MENKHAELSQYCVFHIQCAIPERASIKDASGF